MRAIEAAGTEHQYPTDAATILRRAAVSGACASLLSSGMLACGGTIDCGSAFAPVNAVSHWIWGERALHANRPSVRHTVLGYVIHHAMSVFWAVFYETAVARHPARGALGTLALGGLGVAGLACLVDLKCTPHRLTPGFERRLSPPMLTLVYLAFGLALPLGSLLGSLLVRRAARSRGSLQGGSAPIARLTR
ncbi:Lipoprotein [Cupriavidus oxalaticus]